MRKRTVRWSMVMVAMAGAATWVCFAAPVLPDRNLITNEIYSLGRIPKLKVEVDSKSKLLDAEGLDTDEIKRVIENLLIGGGINVVQGGDDVPTVTYVILTSRDSRFEEIISVTHHLSLAQPVLIRRLEKDIVVPTYALVHGVLVSKHRILFDMSKPIPQLVNHFLKRMDTANTVVGRQEIRDMAD